MVVASRLQCLGINVVMDTLPMCVNLDGVSTFNDLERRLWEARNDRNYGLLSVQKNDLADK